MAEAELGRRSEAPRPGMRFRYAENHDGFFAAAITEVERRDEQWIVVRLDRLKEPLPESEVGLREIK